MSRSAPKAYYLVMAKSHFYCVPARDLLITGNEAKLGQEVPFKYNSLHLCGKVLFISDRESEVMSQIKMEKKALKKREKSFDAEKPRQSALRQRELMESMKPGAKVTKDMSKEAKKKQEKAKKAKREKAADVMETAMVNETSKTNVKNDSDGGDTNPSDDQNLEGEGSSGCSSIETSNEKCKTSGKKKDIDSLKDLEPTSDEEALASSAMPSPKCTVGDQSDTLKAEMASTHDEEVFEFNDGVMKDNGEDVESHYNSDSGGKRKRSSSPSSLLSDTSSEKKKRSRSSSSSSSTSSSSSSSSSESSPEETTSESSEEDRKKKKKNKHKKHRSKKSKKKRSKKSRKTVIKRNTSIYPGVNFKWTGSDPGAVRVHSEYPVYVLETDLNTALKEAKSPQTFIKTISGHVFTSHCLQGSTAQGYPNRNQGKKKMRQEDVLPQVDPMGRKAILRRAEDLESERKSWRPKIGKSAMAAAFTAAVGSYKNN